MITTIYIISEFIMFIIVSWFNRKQNNYLQFKSFKNVVFNY